MNEPRLFAESSLFSIGLLALGLTVCGCEKADKIHAYTVPKHESLQTKEYLADYARRNPQPIPRRMIGVVVPAGQMFWFFKLEGNVDAVAARENDVREFLKTLNLSDPQLIDWTLPTGWQRLPGSEMRYATLVLNGQPPLDMSVTKLPIQPGIDLIDQVLANINRWRGQLSLAPIDTSDLSRESQKLTIGNTEAYWVNLLGTAIPKALPMAAPHPPVTRREEPPQSEPPSDIPKFEKPAEWAAAPAAMFAKVSLQVIEGDAKVAITVTAARGNPVDNVNRWRGQLKLEPIAEDKLMETAKKVEVGKLSGDLYELTNGERTILGVIVQDGDQMWFVKLDGNSKLAEREHARFEGFLKSLQFE